jgi:hypothetical protein
MRTLREPTMAGAVCAGLDLLAFGRACARTASRCRTRCGETVSRDRPRSRQADGYGVRRVTDGRLVVGQADSSYAPTGPLTLEEPG